MSTKEYHCACSVEGTGIDTNTVYIPKVPAGQLDIRDIRS